LQVLVALACDLGLDSLLVLPSAAGADHQKWLWFRRYCIASRVAMALQHRTSLSLPIIFCDEVFKKVQELTADDEQVDRSYESHELFGNEQDEQLLMWLNRYLWL
jgi:E3 ubiquitin-protein ligase HERC2